MGNFLHDDDYSDLPPGGNEEIEHRAEELAAHLLIFTYLPKTSCRDLVLDEELRSSVMRRLSGVGMQLVDSAYSAYFAVRLKTSIESDVTFDWSTNLRLNKGAVALLVVLWSKLVLPKRVAMERREDPNEPNLDLFPERRPRRPVELSVHRDALYAEFGDKFGKVNFQRYLGQLRNLGFITEDRAGNVGEGPLLDLMIDSADMAMKLKDSVLWEMLGGDEEQALDAREQLMVPPRFEPREGELSWPEGLEAADVQDEFANAPEPWSVEDASEPAPATGRGRGKAVVPEPSEAPLDSPLTHHAHDSEGE